MIAGPVRHICRYCATRPLLSKANAATCGHPACMRKHKIARQEADRRARGVPPLSRPRECRYCGTPFTWIGRGMPPVACKADACRKAHQRDRTRRWHASLRGQGLPVPQAASAPEPTDRVERLIAAARAARLARERATGQRTYTIEPDSTYVRADGRVVAVRGGWLQRPGAGDFDGVNGAWSTDGEAW